MYILDDEKNYFIFDDDKIHALVLSDTYATQRVFAESTLQISLDLCIPEKELAKTRSQISFIYIQSHSWYSARNY